MWEQLAFLEQLSTGENGADLETQKQELFQILYRFKSSLPLAIAIEQHLTAGQLSSTQKHNFLAELEEDLISLTSQMQLQETTKYASLYKEMLGMGVKIYQQTQFWHF